MAIVDEDYGKYFGVQELMVNETETIVFPDIIERSVDLLEKIVRFKECRYIVMATEKESVTFFPTKREAEDFQDSLVVPRTVH